MSTVCNMPTCTTCHPRLYPAALTTTPPPSAAVPDPADVEKAARAVFAASFGNGEDYPWEKADPTEHDCARHWAAAALAAVRPSPDSEAVARVEALADEMERRREAAYAADEPGMGDAYGIAASRIRAALGTGDREGGR